MTRPSKRSTAVRSTLERESPWKKKQKVPPSAGPVSPRGNASTRNNDGAARNRTRRSAATSARPRTLFAAADGSHFFPAAPFLSHSSFRPLFRVVFCFAGFGFFFAPTGHAAESGSGQEPLDPRRCLRCDRPSSVAVESATAAARRLRRVLFRECAPSGRRRRRRLTAVRRLRGKYPAGLFPKYTIESS